MRGLRGAGHALGEEDQPGLPACRKQAGDRYSAESREGAGRPARLQNAALLFGQEAFQLFQEAQLQ